MSRKKKTVHILDQLRKLQQSELNSEYMYLTLARKTDVLKDREALLRIAKQKARHSEIYKCLTNEEMRAKKKRAVLASALYKLFGKKGLYPMIAFLEYRAHFRTGDLARKFSSIREIWNDQKRHGDMLAKLVY